MRFSASPLREGAATNSPSALRELLEQWRVLLADDFESGTPDAWTLLVP